MVIINAENWSRAQLSVLGCALLQEEVAALVLRDTREEDYTDHCLAVYRAMKELMDDGVPIDPVSVGNRLGTAYIELLKQMMEITPSAASVRHHIPILRHQSRMNRIKLLGEKMAEAKDEDEVTDLLGQGEKLLSEQSRGSVSTMQDMIRDFFDESSEARDYVPWPIPALSQRLYVEQGDMVILGGYPSAGKSAFALQCAALWSKTKRVGFYSLETSSGKLFQRLLAHTQGIAFSEIKQRTVSDETWARVAPNWESLSKMPIEVVGAAGFSVADIRAMASRRKHDIVIIDYLQLVRGKGNGRYEQVTGVSMDLHTMAQTTKTLIIALSQLRRTAPGIGEPTMSDLRESGQIEQDADLIMLLYPADPTGESSDRTLRVVKNKEGTCPAIRLAFDGQHQRFTKADAPAGTAARGRLPS